MANSNTKVLVTGALGKIGSKVIPKLLADHHQVTTVDLKEHQDCADLDVLNKICKGNVDVIIHLAAHLPPEVDKNTMDANQAVYEFAKYKDAKVIYASSAAIYEPTTEYAVHKLHGEILFRQLPNHAILRLFNVYGMNGDGLIDKMLRKETITINGGGVNKRDYVHVEDVVSAFIDALEYDFVGTADIGTGESYSVIEAMEMFEYLGRGYEKAVNDGGILYSQAKLNPSFPWFPAQKLPEYAASVVQTA